MNLWECCGDDRPGEIGTVRRWIGFSPSACRGEGKRRRGEEEDAADLLTAGQSLIKLFMVSGTNANTDHHYTKS